VSWSTPTFSVFFFFFNSSAIGSASFTPLDNRAFTRHALAYPELSRASH
jgi:hypothetical protein